MIAFQEALEIIKANARPFGQERVAIDEALDRVLARDVIADRDYPPFNRSAMDGFAFRIEDWEEGKNTFVIREVIYAGQENKHILLPGECYKIMTGAAVPSVANCVVRREDTIEGDGQVEIRAEGLKTFQNIARQGEDVKQGKVVVAAQERCTPSVIGALATTGNATVWVEKLPKVAVFTTGDEVVAVDSAVSPVQIRNSNSHLLKALLKKWQIEPQLCSHIPDDKRQLETTLKKALSCNIIIMSGGVSAGDADYVPEVMESLGVVKLFHKVAIRPGKPIWCGLLPNGGMVFALPGNPFSCRVTFTLFVEKYLSLALDPMINPVREFPLVESRYKKHMLTEFFPVKLENTFAPQLLALAINGSGDISAGLHADGLGVHPSDITTLKAGEQTGFIPFR